jgi:hypothetical protein
MILESGEMGEELVGVVDLLAGDGVWASGIALGGDHRSHGGEKGCGLLDASPGDVRIGVSGAEEDGSSSEIAWDRHGDLAIVADQTSGEGDQAAVLGGIAGDELG